MFIKDNQNRSLPDITFMEELIDLSKTLIVKMGFQGL